MVMMMTDRLHSLLHRCSKLSLVWFLFGLVCSRLALLSFLLLMTHGHELGNDVSMHMAMVRSPFAVLLYKVPAYEQHPPFLPFLESAIAFPLQTVFSDFVSIRVLMITYELGLGFIFYRLMTRLSLSSSRKGFCLCAFLLLPTGWMTTTVMGQDDSIGACGFLLPLLLYISSRKRLALLLAGVGVVAAKLFFILELICLVPLTTLSSSRQRAGNILESAAIGFAPIFLVYGAISIERLTHTQPLPLLGFRPDPYFGTNFWMVLQRDAGFNLHRMGTISGIVALAAALTPCLILYHRSERELSARDVLTCAAACLLLFFSLFYHVEPEYFTIVMPVLILTAESSGDAVWLTLVAIVVWAGKFFQNASVLYEADVNSGKAVALKAFTLVFRSSPLTWLTADQLVFSVLALYVSVRWTHKLMRPHLPAGPYSHLPTP